jgi:hypothetical protein
MAGHSRPKDGVLSHAYVPAIHVFIISSGSRRHVWHEAGQGANGDDQSL